MGEFVAENRLKDFYNREINEIMQNKLRFGLIATSLLISVAIFVFHDDESEVTAATDREETPKIVAAAKSTNDDAKSNETSTKVTEIVGLARASEGIELINPFKSDLIKPPVETKAPEPVKAQIPLPMKTPPIKTIETDEQVILTLKGTAISGDKKMAIIQRSIVNKSNSKNSKDNKKSESYLLNIGDEIDGRRLIAIDKDFVIFDDDSKLHLQEAL